MKKIRGIIFEQEKREELYLLGASIVILISLIYQRTVMLDAQKMMYLSVNIISTSVFMIAGVIVLTSLIYKKTVNEMGALRRILVLSLLILTIIWYALELYFVQQNFEVLMKVLNYGGLYAGLNNLVVIILMKVLFYLIIVVSISVFASTIYTLVTTKEVQKKTIIDTVKKYKKSTVIIIIATALSLGSFGYFTFLYKTEIDVFDYVSLNAIGVSGEGQLTIGVNHPPEKVEQNAFWTTLKVVADKNEGMANGDKINITVVPNDEAYNKAKIVIKLLEKEYTISGLRAIPSSLDEIPTIEKLDAIMRKNMEDTFYSKGTKAEVTNVCYKKIPEKFEKSGTQFSYGTVVNIYKITKEATTYSKESTSFGAQGITGITVNADGTLHDGYKEWAVYTQTNFTDMLESLKKYDIECGGL